jgi:hypothetical protein
MNPNIIKLQQFLIGAKITNLEVMPNGEIVISLNRGKLAISGHFNMNMMQDVNNAVDIVDVEARFS